MYELITAHPPFTGEHLIEIANKIELSLPASPSELRPGIHPAIDQICHRALAKKPADRFATMAEIAEALAAVGQD